MKEGRKEGRKERWHAATGENIYIYTSARPLVA